MPQWSELGGSAVRTWPLPELPRLTDRLLARLSGLAALRGVLSVDGWENIAPERDPFLLVSNHSSRRETLYLTAVLLLARRGCPVRFLADWNFRLIPGVGLLYDRSGAITLTGKPARPRFLNRLKPWFEPAMPPFEEARKHLKRGGSIGIFPEGTVNRDGNRLLRGRRGAARLSLEAGVPVVPMGIRFARRDPGTGATDSTSPMSIRFGTPIDPPNGASSRVSSSAVNDWHARLMGEIGLLCGKRWEGRRRHN